MEKSYVTLKEIAQQGEMWLNTLGRIEEKRKEIDAFLEEIKTKHGNIRVVFTGAGTSNYVGDVVQPYLREKQAHGFEYESIPTTDLVSSPYEYIQNRPTLLVSFARSGNSPESVAAVALYEDLVDDLYQIVITCAEEGQLARHAREGANTLLLLLDERTNDRGFAMTSSFTSMTLATLLLFDETTSEQKRAYVEEIVAMGEYVKEESEQFRELVEESFKRVVYLGSGVLGKLAREAQLKILELTGGKIATCFDSSMGFRHGPKSFVDSQTLVVDFVSNNAYTRLYDVDIITELKSDGIAKLVYPVSTDRELDGFVFRRGEVVPDAYLSLPFVMIAQYISTYAAMHLDNDVDNPSASGTVNRVVKGVVIHPYK